MPKKKTKYFEEVQNYFNSIKMSNKGGRAELDKQRGGGKKLQPKGNRKIARLR